MNALRHTICILLCFASYLVDAQAPVMASNYVIAYSSNESGQHDIYLTDTEGKSRVKVTDFSGGNGYSAWSPDGQKIAFYAKYDDRKTWSIHTINVDGTDRKRLTDVQNYWDNAPTWSRDGSQIVFARAYRDSLEIWHHEIWIMNADGSNQRQIPGIEGGGPHFTSDGKIVFHSQPGPSDIFIVNLDGSELTQLTDNETEDWHPEVSHDGKQIAYMSNVSGVHQIRVMNIDGTAQKQLTEMANDAWYPSWSPDGSELIFSSKTDEVRTLYKMTSDGSSIKPIVVGGSQAAWYKRPDQCACGRFDKRRLEGPYMGQRPPGPVPEPFASGIVCTKGWEVEGVFAPNMKEFYFTMDKGDSVIGFKPTIIGFRQEGNVWKKYIEFPRNGETAFTPDGNRMLLAEGYRDRVGDGWSERKSLGAFFDREDWGIMRLTASNKGTYVFDDYKSGDVIRISTIKNGKRQRPKKMGTIINSGEWTAHPFIAPDESYLIWDSERKGGYGDSDLYVSFRQEDGAWGPAINLGDKVNTDKWEAFGSVTADGKYLLFNRGVDTDSRNTDIYWVSAEVIESLRPE